MRGSGVWRRGDAIGSKGLRLKKGLNVNAKDHCPAETHGGARLHIDQCPGHGSDGNRSKHAHSGRSKGSIHGLRTNITDKGKRGREGPKLCCPIQRRVGELSNRTSRMLQGLR